MANTICILWFYCYTPPFIIIKKKTIYYTPLLQFTQCLLFNFHIWLQPFSIFPNLHFFFYWSWNDFASNIYCSLDTHFTLSSKKNCCEFWNYEFLPRKLFSIFTTWN